MSPPRAALWRLALPLIGANVSVALLGLTDTAVVGYLPGPAYLAGVALGGTLFSFLYWGLGFLRMGTAGLAAQAYGAGDAAALRGVLVQALAVAGTLGLLILLVQGPLVRTGLALAGAGPEVSAQAARYFTVRIWGAPAVLGGYVLLGFLLAVQDARSALLVLVSANVLNVALDLLLVVGLGQGVAGVAAASVAADSAGIAVAGWRVRRALARQPRAKGGAALWERARLVRLVAVNRDIFLRTLCLIFAFAWFNVQGARLGEAVLAASAVLMSLHLATAQVLDGIAHAAEALVGRAVGARDAPSLHAVLRVAGLDSMAVAAGFAIVYGAGGWTLVGLLTDLPAVQDLARAYLPWLVVLPLLAAPGFFLDGVLIGATRAREMRDVMALALLAVYLPLWWLTRPWGAHGLWAAFCAFTAARGVLMAAALWRIERRGGLVRVPS